MHAARMDGVTEVRAGVYMFGDLFQGQIATHPLDDIAVTVLASRHRPPARSATRCCWMPAPWRCRRTAAPRPRRATGASAGCWTCAGQPLPGEPMVARAYQEHGEVHAEAPLPFDRLPIGARLRVVPNHSCLTAAAHDRYHVVEGGREVIAIWDRVNGW